MRLLAGVVAAAGVLLAGLASAQRAPVTPPNLEVVVDGELRHTWSGAELATRQSPERHLKGGFRPMVKLMDALPLDTLGVARERVVGVVVRGDGRALELKGPALEYLGELLLQIDVDKGSVWKLVPRTPEVEKALKRLVGGNRVQAVRRIELTTGPPVPPKS